MCAEACGGVRRTVGRGLAFGLGTYWRGVGSLLHVDWLGPDALLCRRASLLAGRMRLGLDGWSWRCGSALAVPRFKSWSSLRPVLKHGPRSLAYTRVIGWKTHRRNESEGLFLRLICDPLHYGVCEAA